MLLQLVQVLSTDRLALPGALYSPGKASKKIAILLHGMGDNGVFYKPLVVNTLAEELTSAGIALLAFNNRGAHSRKNLLVVDDSLPVEERNYVGGTHYEKIADCVKDIDGAIAFARENGYSEFYLIGHSTGANKICAYHSRTSDNPFSKYVLSGPGDDSGNSYCELGDKRFWKAIAYAKRAIESNKPLTTLPKYTGMYPFSAQAALDILDPDGAYNTFPYYEATNKRLGTKPLFQELKKIDRTFLTIFGEFDEYTYTAGGTIQALNLIRQYTRPKIAAQCSYQLVHEADHSFLGHERDWAHQIATWLEGKNGKN